MKATKEQIKEEVLKILNDFKIDDYYKDRPFKIQHGKDKIVRYSTFKYEEGWKCFVYTSNWQFETHDGMYIYTFETDGTAYSAATARGGRPLPTVYLYKDENDKYYAKTEPDNNLTLD